MNTEQARFANQVLMNLMKLSGIEPSQENLDDILAQWVHQGKLPAVTALAIAVQSI